MIDIGMMWRDQPPPRKEPDILGVRWRELPIKFRQRCWKETDYGRRPVSETFKARLPQLIADAIREVENDKREIAADVAHARELVRQARQPPCESCLRPAAPCQRRCLRSLLLPNDPRVKARMTDVLLLAIRELIQAAEREIQRFERIEAAYQAALAGRDPKTVRIDSLLPAIFAAVPDTTTDEIAEALRWSARKNFREADELERFGQERQRKNET
jgi:hypothetical protein